MTTRKKALIAIKTMIPCFAQRVAPIYELLGWTWYQKGIPSEEQIREALFESVEFLLKDGKATTTESGGLRVEYEPEFFCANLKFILTQYCHCEGET